MTLWARAAEAAYRAAVRFVGDRGHALRVPGTSVVSVGNLVAGGAGKTPCALWWARALSDRGVATAVVCRPWGPPAGEHPGDEAALLAQGLPKGVRLYAGKSKRAEAARAAAEGARVVVIDDGFSHRGLARDLDLVLLDARSPFGNGRCLPAGPLREPPEALARAHAVVLSRADRADAEGRRRSREQVRAAGFEGPILSARHRVLGVRDGDALVPAAGLAVYCASGLARSGELAEAAAAAGLCVRGAEEFPDHHAFTAAEWRRVEDEARARDARVLVTAKDAVRLPGPARAAALVLEIAWEWMEGDVEPERLVDRVIAARTAS